MPSLFIRQATLLVTIFVFSSCSTFQEIEQKYLSKPKSESTSSTVKKRQVDFSLPSNFNAIRDRKGEISSLAYQKLLVQAVESQNVTDIQKYLQSGANPNRGKSDSEENSALNIAISTGCFDCLQAMKSKADFNFTYYGTKYLPMVVASQHSLEMLKYIFNNFSVNPNAYSYGNHSRGGKHFALNYVINYGKEGTAEYLLEKGADPMYGRYSPWEDFVQHSKKINNPIPLAKTLIKHGVDFNMQVKGSGPTSPLGRVIENEQYEIAKLFLEAGADPNYCHPKARGFHKPLYWAIKRDNYDMVKSLLEKGENVNILDLSNCEVTTSQTPLSFALDKSRSKAMIDLLLQYGAK